jgi:hypothetical protein
MKTHMAAAPKLIFSERLRCVFWRGFWVALLALAIGCDRSQLKVTECHFEKIAVLDAASLNEHGEAPCLFVRTEPDASTFAVDDVELVTNTGETYAPNKTLLKGDKPGLFLRKGKAFLFFVVKDEPSSAMQLRIRLKRTRVEAPIPNQIQKGIPKDD